MVPAFIKNYRSPNQAAAWIHIARLDPRVDDLPKTIRASSTETPLTRIYDNPTREASCSPGRNKQFDHTSDCNLRVGQRAKCSPGADVFRFTPKRTSLNRGGMSVRCQKLTHASQQNDVLEFLVLHSSNASAPRIIPGGISSPSALAVLRLTTISSLVGCSTGRSAGFTPFRILST